jgi:ribosomal-protein-alanine N-acetyltransferase
MKLKIRKAELSDVPWIMQIEQNSFTEPWQDSSFKDEITDHEVFVISYNQELIGYICGWKILDEYNITNLAIRSDLRKKGLGDLLVSYVMSLHREDCSLIYLEVRESNLAARKLYKKRGFKIIGIRKNYYSDPSEDAILMGIKFS